MTLDTTNSDYCPECGSINIVKSRVVSDYLDLKCQDCYYWWHFYDGGNNDI